MIAGTRITPRLSERPTGAIQSQTERNGLGAVKSLARDAAQGALSPRKHGAETGLWLAGSPSALINGSALLVSGGEI